MTLRIGLTGGIGSGKSTVADLFRVRGVPIIDADIITRKLVEPGQSALDEITAQLGKSFLNPNGTLDRARLRDHIFHNASDREKLEAILHPLVAQEIENQTQVLTAPYCIIVIPLLFESGQENLVDRVLVVDAPEELSIERVVARDDTESESVRQIKAAQLDRKERMARADDVIVNDSDLGLLEKQVQLLHGGYLAMAAFSPSLGRG